MMNLVAVKCGAIVHFVDNPREIVDSAREVQPRLFVGVPRFYEKLLSEIRSRLPHVLLSEIWPPLPHVFLSEIRPGLPFEKPGGLTFETFQRGAFPRRNIRNIYFHQMLRPDILADIFFRQQPPAIVNKVFDQCRIKHLFPMVVRDYPV